MAPGWADSRVAERSPLLQVGALEHGEEWQHGGHDATRGLVLAGLPFGAPFDRADPQVDVLSVKPDDLCPPGHPVASEGVGKTVLDWQRGEQLHEFQRGGDALYRRRVHRR